jgi:hypothetical protein
MKNNGRAKKVEEVVDAVMDALQDKEMDARDVVESIDIDPKATAAGARGMAVDAGTKVVDAAEDVGARAARAARDAEVADKVERVLDLIEQNAGLLAGLARRVGGEAVKQAPLVAGAVAEAAGDAAKQAPAVAAAVGEAAGEAAGAAGEAAGEAASALGEAAGKAIELIGEELVQPVTRYGRGLRHGLVVGAVIAVLVTPWPGRVLREKLKAAGQEAMDLVNALREGAADSRV